MANLKTRKVILSENFSQVYLNANSDKWATRIRLINNNQAFITLKSSLSGFTNYEFEYQIPIKDAIDTVTQIQTRLMSSQYEQLIKKTKFGR